MNSEFPRRGKTCLGVFLALSRPRKPDKYRAMFRICIACIFVLSACSGCEIISLAAFGTALDIAGTAVTAGPEVFQAGKLDTALMAEGAQCRSAVEHAADDLKLLIARNRDLGDGKWDFQLQDNFRSKIEVTLQVRTPKLCRCRVNVGLFGGRPTAELIMRRIEAHLPAASTMPIHHQGES